MRTSLSARTSGHMARIWNLSLVRAILFLLASVCLRSKPSHVDVMWRRWTLTHLLSELVIKLYDKRLGSVPEDVVALQNVFQGCPHFTSEIAKLAEVTLLRASLSRLL